METTQMIGLETPEDRAQYNINLRSGNAIEITPTIGLEKPEDSEYYDVELHNRNADRIDAECEKLEGNAFIPCTAVYSSLQKQFELNPTQAGLVLPPVFTVRWIAPAAFSAGDKLVLGGVVYTPAYTDGSDAVEVGAWARDAVVRLELHTAAAKAFVGRGFGSRFAQLPTKGYVEGELGKRVSHSEKNLLYSRGSYAGSTLLARVRGSVEAGYLTGCINLWEEAFLPDCPVQWGVASYIHHTTGFISVTVQGDWNQPTYFRRIHVDVWEWLGTGWREVVYNDKPAVYPLQQAADCVNLNCTYFKTQNGVATLSGEIYKAGGGTFATPNQLIGTLPEGFRPAYTVHTPANCHMVSGGNALVIVNRDGTVILYNAPSGSAHVVFTASFIVP